MAAPLHHPLEHPNLPLRAYQIIKGWIVNQDLGPGAKLQEDALADRLGVSRTPIREALSRLAQEGLVTMVPRRGTFVVDLTREDIVELYEVREAIEGMAAHLAARRRTPDQLRQMQAAFAPFRDGVGPGDLTAYAQADLLFHDLLLRAAGNRGLQQVAGSLNDRMQMLRLRSVVLPGRASRSLAEHGRIIEALAAADPEAAEVAAREHMRNVRDDVLRALAAGPPTGGARPGGGDGGGAGRGGA